MKKIFAGILSVVLVASAFAGCSSRGNNGNTAEKPNLSGVDYTFEDHDIGDTVYVKVVDAGLGSEWIDALADAYYEETGITVETSADADLGDTVERAMGQSGSQKEDLYFVSEGNSNWLDWISNQKIAALDDVVGSDKYGSPALERTQDDMILQIGKYGDNTYLLPYVYSNWGLIYNQTYLDQIDSYGEYTKGEWPKTMQGLIDLCTATKSAGLVNARTKQTVKPFSCGLTVNYMNYLFYALWDELDSEGLTAYLNQSNTSMYDASEFNSAEVKQVFETLYDLIGAKSETESNLCSAAEDHLDSQKNFVNGNCVFTFSGVWFETEMQTILKSVGMTSYHYGAYPVINSADQNRLYMNLPGEYFFIPSDAENVWGAKDFLAFCMSEEGIAAAERKLSMPLAYTTDEKVEFTSFGKEIQTVVDNSKKLYVYSTSNIYKTGALTFFLQTTNPFIQMSKYRITSKSDIVSKCITTEIAQHNATWDDYMKHLS